MGPMVRSVNNGELSMVIPVTVEGTCVEAVIDTASDATFISVDLNRKLTNPITTGVQVPCSVARKGGGMMGLKSKRHKIKVGSKTYQNDIVVADIVNDCILGMDFIVTHRAVVDPAQNQFIVGREVITTTLRRGRGPEPYRVSRIFLDKDVVVPPHSLEVAGVELGSPSDTCFVIQPTSMHKDMHMSSTYAPGSDDEAAVSFTDSSDNYSHLNNGQLLDEAIEADGTPLSQQESVEDAPLVDLGDDDTQAQDVISLLKMDIGENAGMKNISTQTSAPSCDEMPCDQTRAMEWEATPEENTSSMWDLPNKGLAFLH